MAVIPSERPVLFASRHDENLEHYVRDYLKLNNISPDFIVHDLKKEKDNGESKAIIKYKDFSFEIIKNYKNKITNSADCVKLPILMKNAPSLYSVFLSFPKYLIVNDYKRLSQKSIKDIVWLKSKPVKTLFLSETGTITIVSDGEKYKIIFEEY